MKIHVVQPGQEFHVEGERCLVVPMFQDMNTVPTSILSSEDEALISGLRKRSILTAKAGETYYIRTENRAYEGILVVGLGKRDDFEPETLRRAAGSACRSLQTNRVTAVVLDAAPYTDLPIEAFVEGLALSQYQFQPYKNPPKDGPEPTQIENLTCIISSESAVDAAKARCDAAAIVCGHANWARDLAHQPANHLTPGSLAQRAGEMAAAVGLEYEHLDAERMAELGMNALLAVGKGSAEPPSFIILRYRYDVKAPTLGLVGKGITFDTGGISIKPSDGLHEMKYDMCGAAAVLGAMAAIAELKPSINVTAFVPAAENVPGSRAQKPGDIVRAYNGKTIEVNNTDAEGRLILADALAYMVDTEKPARIVDLATLTGACIVALGHQAAALLSTDDELANHIEESANRTAERVWRLPLWADYDKLIEGTHADLCNIGPAREAGTIVGGSFLKAFVGDTPWAHLDIAGAAWGVKNVPYWSEKYATGYGVRLMVDWVRREAERNG